MEKLNSDVITSRSISKNLAINTNGKCVLYVMTRDQRVTDNYGLWVAQQIALQKKVPFAVVVSLFPNTSQRALEHFDFMLTGLREIEQSLQKLSIPLIVLFGKHIDTIQSIAYHTKPALIISDFSPLIGVRRWQDVISSKLPHSIIDSHNIVPVWVASSKQEVGARTIRPKIHKYFNEYLHHSPLVIKKHPHAWPGTVIPLSDLHDKLEAIRKTYKSNATNVVAKPGESAAQKALSTFITKRLKGYADNRNDPSLDGLSGLSPYLHFGTLASSTVVIAAIEASLLDENLQNDVEALVEEIVVRKELSDNYCYYNQNYKMLQGAPQWAQNTLQKHATDIRAFTYALEEFENAVTHDLAWNAAQKQLRRTGKMHGYMRMYWAKKVLEWSASPEQALQTLLYLNDFYSIDGGDPNGYVGILWSIAGLHDRPWGERPVYGTVRSMVYNGLKRKFNIEAYIQKYET